MSRGHRSVSVRLREIIGTRGSLRRETLGAVGGTGAIYLINFLLVFGTAVLLARGLGAEELGLYAFVLAILNMLSVPARLGLSTLLVRETARALDAADWPLMRGLWSWSALLGLLGSALLVAALLWLAPRMPGVIDADRRAVLEAGILLVPLLGLGGLVSAALRGLHRVPQSVVPELAVRPGLLLALVGGMALAGGAALDAVHVMAFNAAATGAAFMLALGLLWRHAPAPVRRAGPVRRETAGWLRAALPFALTAGLMQVNENLAILSLGTLSSDTEAGVYRVIMQMALLGSLLLAPLHLVIAPHMSRLHSRGERARLQWLVTRTARADAALTGAYLLGIGLFGHWFIGAVFGAEFAVGHGALMIVLAGQFLAALCGPVADLTSMTGQERATLLGVGVGCGLNLALCLLLVPGMGSTGAAVAVAVSLVANRGLLAVLARRRLGIATLPFGRV